MSVAVMLAYLAFRTWPSVRGEPLLDRGAPYFAVAGLAQAGGLFAVYVALSYGMVSVVVRLYTSSPLFVLPLSAMLLRGVERVSLRTVVGALIVVLGVALVSLY